MTWSYLLVGSLSVADMLIGGYVLSKGPRRPLNRTFFAFAFGAALIGGSMVLLLATHSIFFDRLIFAGGYLMIFGLVLLSMKFPSDEPIRPAIWLIFLPLALLAALTPFGFLVKEVIFRPDNILQPVNGSGIHLFAAVIGAYLLWSARGFYKRYASLSGASRLQMQYLALGAGVFAFTTFLCNVLLPALGFFDLNMLGPISSMVFVGAVAYAIVRHQLLDIRVVVQRSAIYLALLAAVTGFYLALIFASASWLQGTAVRQDAVFLGVGILTVCLGIFTVPYLEAFFRKVTDRIFFKDRYDYPKALHVLSAILNHNIETGKIRRQACQALKDILKASEVHMFLFEDGSDPLVRVPWYAHVRDMAHRQKNTLILARWTLWADGAYEELRKKHGIEVVTPILLGRKPIGAIVLGPKRSGDPYLNEDAELLATFSYQAAMSLEKARLFEELKKYSGALEDKVRERTLELERLQEEQRQMMIDISHRLQTPLAAVRSELDLMSRQSKTTKQLEAFGHSIDDISKFIYDLLNLARLGVGRGQISMEHLDLSGILRELTEYFGVMAAEQDIRLVTGIESGIFMAGSRDHIEELVTNLVSNAFKYLDVRRGKEVSVSLRRVGEGAVLEVADNGIGISPEDTKKIFERFYRGRRKGASASSGTGLGLAIAKSIVENHGGTIAVESRLDAGTKVIVTLPFGSCAEERI